MCHLILKIFDDCRLEVFRSVDLEALHFTFYFSGNVFELLLASLNLRFPLKV